MKKYKSLLAIILIVALLTFTLSGCGDKTNTSSKTSESEKSFTDESMFSDNDLDATYDESKATKLTLSGSENVEITKEGTYILSGSLTDASIVVNADEKADIKLVLDGVTVDNSKGAALLVVSADKVYITLKEGSDNSLTSSGTFETAYDLDNIDGTIFSKSTITFNGSGTLTVSCANGNGIVSKDNVKVTGGTLNITTSGHGIEGKDSVRIKYGTITINSTDKGIKSKNSDDSEKGYVYISGGKITINSGTEGIEGTRIYIADGTIDITAKDDGMNAASSQDDAEMYIKIVGGTIHVNASGDGLDSNGNIYVDGGTTYISGSENGGDGALDYGDRNCTATITGGTIIASGNSGMAENFGSDSTQCSIMVTFQSNHTSNDKVTLTDSDGNVLAEWTPDKAYNNVVISCDKITSDGTFTVSAGSESQEVTMEGTIYGESNGFMGGGNFNKDNMGKPSGEMPSGEVPSDFDPSNNPYGNPPSGNFQPGEKPSMPNNDSGSTSTTQAMTSASQTVAA